MDKRGSINVKVILILAMLVIVLLSIASAVILFKPKQSPKLPPANTKTITQDSGGSAGQQLFNDKGRMIGDVLIGTDVKDYKIVLLNKSSLLKLLYDWKLFDRGYNLPYGVSNIPVNKVLIVLTDKPQPTFVRKDSKNNTVASSSVKIQDGEIDVFVNLSADSLKNPDEFFEEQVLSSLFTINYGLLVPGSSTKNVKDEFHKAWQRKDTKTPEFLHIEKVTK